MIPGPLELLILGGGVGVLFFGGRLPQIFAMLQARLTQEATKRVQREVDQFLAPETGRRDEPED